jgi:hypothetical protein
MEKKGKTMKGNDLEKRGEELERTLELQIQQLKKDSGVWLKVGGAIMVMGLLSFAVTRAVRGQKTKQKVKLERVEPEEIRKKRQRKRPSRRSSFFSSLKKRLFLTLLSYGEVKLMDELKKRTGQNEK